MVLVPVTYPYWQSDQVSQGSQTEIGQQRYRCQQTHCPRRFFLKISPTIVINELKKASSLSSVNQRLLALLHPDEVEVVIRDAKKRTALAVACD